MEGIITPQPTDGTVDNDGKPPPSDIGKKNTMFMHFRPIKLPKLAYRNLNYTSLGHCNAYPKSTIG